LLPVPPGSLKPSATFRQAGCQAGVIAVCGAVRTDLNVCPYFLSSGVLPTILR